MGMFDEFVDICPWCGKEANPQTKLGENLCLQIKPGDADHLIALDSTEPASFVLKCKNPCEHCKHELNAKIEENRFVGFTKDNATHEEFAWGNYEKC